MPTTQFAAIFALFLTTVLLGGSTAHSDDTAQSPTWSPEVPYSDQTTGNLKLRVHPLSPVNCGIELVEIGAQGPAGFAPEMALLRDQFDSSYPGVLPEIRRAYSYDMPPDYNQQVNPADTVTTASPPLLVDTATVKAKIVGKLTYTIAKTVVAYVGSLPGRVAAVAVDQFVQSYLKKAEYYRARMFYTLQILEEAKNSDLTQFFNLEEIQDFLAVGREQSYAGILMTPAYEQLANQSQDDQRRLNRQVNFANLLSAVNREGLIAQPLFKDFVMVYYDPKQASGRPIDILYTDLSESPENQALKKGAYITQQGLVALGIYAIGQDQDRLKTIDLEGSPQIKDRRLIQQLDLLGVDAGANFVAFPFSLLIKGGSAGAAFELNKAGKNVLTSTIDSEAELAALLDSGVAGLDPDLVEQIRGDMAEQDANLLDVNEKTVALNRVANTRQMTTYLSNEGNALCAEIRSLREGDFRSEYLDVPETIGRTGSSIAATVTGNSATYDQNRKQVIAQRTPLVQARMLLTTYDPASRPYPPEQIVLALQIVGETKDPNDADAIAGMINYRIDTDVVLAAIQAAGTNGAGDLAHPLCDFLDDFDLKANPYYHDDVNQAINSLEALDIAHAQYYPDVLFDKALKTLNRLRNSGAQDVAAQAQDAYLKIWNDSYVYQTYKKRR